MKLLKSTFFVFVIIMVFISCNIGVDMTEEELGALQIISNHSNQFTLVSGTPPKSGTKKMNADYEVTGDQGYFTEFTIKKDSTYSYLITPITLINVNFEATYNIVATYKYKGEEKTFTLTDKLEANSNQGNYTFSTYPKINNKRVKVTKTIYMNTFNKLK